MEEWLYFLFISLLLLLLPLSLRSRPSHFPPGPHKLPIIGSLHHTMAQSPPHRSFFQLSRKHGPLMYLQLGQVPTIVISSATMAKEVLKSHDLDFCSRPPLIAFKRLSYNFLDVAFAPYNDNWREMRKVYVSELFSANRVQSFAFVRGEEVALTVRSISRAASSAELINLSEMMLSLSHNIICRIAFGNSYEDESMRRLQIFLGEAGALMGSFFVGDFLPWLGWVDVLRGLHGRLERNFWDLDGFYEKVIEDHLSPKRVRSDQDDFLDVMLRVQKDRHLGRDNIKAMLMDFLFAAIDTTSAAAVWAMTELVRNSNMMKKAQDEVRTIVGKKGKVEESDLHQLEYLKLVIKETLRLHPPGPLMIPQETRQHGRIDGYGVLPKTRIYVNAFAIGRDPNSWKNPDEFLPERFINSSIHYKGQDFEFIPFGAGRRICPGMNFGTIVVELVVANLLYNFSWELPIEKSKEGMDMSEAIGIVGKKKYPLILRPKN